MTVQEAATEIRELAAVRPRGGGTKLNWGPPSPRSDAPDFDTRRLNRILEHNVGDFTAVLEAGVPLAQAQAAFGAEGQMLALDPPLGEGDAATIGGVIATNDCGPLRHRYGGVRDLVVGMTVVLSDGTIAKSGGKVIKNVAGYDLAKLFAGSFGTLGLIASVAVRLHPAPARSATLTGSSDDPERLGRAALRLAALPLEAECLEAGWERDAGWLSLRFGGTTAAEQAEAARSHLELDGVTIEADDDGDIWALRRGLQRGELVVKVAGRPTDLPTVIREARRAGGTVVSRAALGLSWINLAAGADVAAVREALAPRACTVLDGADRVEQPWPAVDPGVLAVMERIKARFDPDRAFKPGTFVGGL
jgi:glycolate dehydrogenase FAD-binding subunit